MINLRMAVPGSRSISYVARFDCHWCHKAIEHLVGFLQLKSIFIFSRARMLDKIKTDDTFCGDQLESGHFLLYHKVDKDFDLKNLCLFHWNVDRASRCWRRKREVVCRRHPGRNRLLTKITWKTLLLFRFDFATAQRLSPTIKEGIAALGVNVDGVPTFAAEACDWINIDVEMEIWKQFCQNHFYEICQYVKVGEEGAGTVEKVWGGRFTDLRFSLVFSLRYITWENSVEETKVTEV